MRFSQMNRNGKLIQFFKQYCSREQHIDSGGNASMKMKYISKEMMTLQGILQNVVMTNNLNENWSE